MTNRQDIFEMEFLFEGYFKTSIEKNLLDKAKERGYCIQNVLNYTEKGVKSLFFVKICYKYPLNELKMKQKEAETIDFIKQIRSFIIELLTFQTQVSFVNGKNPTTIKYNLGDLK